MYVLEISETRLLLQQPENHFAAGELIGDFIITVQRSLARIHSKSWYTQLRAVMRGHLAPILAPEKCIDAWLVDVASPDFGALAQFMIVSTLLFHFPNLLLSPTQNLADLVKQAFTLMEAKYIQATSTALIRIAEEMIRTPLVDEQ
jgi:hypothetical protein